MRTVALGVALMLLCGCTTEVVPSGDDITFTSGDVTLAGTVVGAVPGERRPGIVFIHGSGPDGRDNHLYWIMAEAFTRRGFVVLIYDKRGGGGSGGDWRFSPFPALVDDAEAAFHALRRHPAVDSNRVGIWGGSEGSVIAPNVALRVPSVRFVIVQSTPGVAFAAQNIHQTTLQIRAATDDSAERAAAMAMLALRHEYARTGQHWDDYYRAVQRARGTAWEGLAQPTRPDAWWWAWYRTKMDYGSRDALAALSAPVLAVWGSEDVLIDVPQAVAVVDSARRKIGNPRDSLVVIDGADHVILINGFRGVLRRGIRNRQVHLDLMANWARRQIVDSAGGR